MRGLPLLAWRSVIHHRTQTAILAACLAVTLALPIGAALGLASYEHDLRARADATPLVVGARGGSLDLVLSALYFRAPSGPALRQADADALAQDETLLVLPMHQRHTTRGRPLVGVVPEYFEYRGLRAQAGSLPMLLGECVVGAAVARDLDLRAGDSLSTDPTEAYDIRRPGSLRMTVSGILAPTGDADDHAVFVDVRTAWIADGVLHGHADAEAPGDPSLLLARDESHVAFGPTLIEETRVDATNRASFHGHGDPALRPLTALVVLPRTPRAATLAKTRVNLDERLMAVVPAQVVDELLRLVLRVESVLRAVFAVLGGATSLLGALVLWLSARLRAGERRTLRRIGAGRNASLALSVLEVGFVLLLALLGAALAIGLGAVLLPDLAHLV